MALRVHICPVGFEVDRIVIPLIERKADIVWLITKSTVNYEEESAEKFIKEIRTQLISANICVKNKECEIHNMVDSLRAMREIFSEELENTISINVSSGNKVQAIAGMMACMMWGAEPYYVIPANYDHPDEPMTHGVEKIVILPRYKIDKPPEAVLECIRVISRKRDYGAKKKEVMIHLENVGCLDVVSDKEGKDPSIQAKYRFLDEHVLKPAHEFGFIVQEGRTRNVRLKLTDEGKEALTIFCEKER